MSTDDQSFLPPLSHPRRRSIVLGVLSFVLLADIATPPASAQDETPGWSGTVEVSPGNLRLTKGGFVTYSLRLTQLPTLNSPNDWWVMIHVEADGVKLTSEGYGGIRWTPSVGWEIRDAPDASPDPENPQATRWYTVTIYADENASVNNLSVTHEVWDHESNCPIHGVGRVSVQVVGDNGGGNGGSGNGGDGNGGNGGDGNGGSGNGGSGNGGNGNGGNGNGGDGNGGDGNGGDGNGGNGNGGDGNGGNGNGGNGNGGNGNGGNGNGGNGNGGNGNGGNGNGGDGNGGGNGGGSDGGGSEGGGRAEAPRLFIGDAGSVAEGAEATFSVTLSARSAEAVTVGYRTIDGTAVAGADYRSTEGTLRFAPGETSQAIVVPVLDDELAEETEQFRVELRDAMGATLAGGTGSASIIDDDEPPTITIDDAPPVNEGESAEFVVRLSAPAGMVVAVSYRTVDGTAVAGADYRSRRGHLRFAPGETSQTIAVPVLHDELSELTETFTVELHDPSPVPLADGSGLGTIVDDDDPPELVIDDAPGVAEGRSAVFPVRLSPAAGHPVTVAYRTADGSALGGADYTASDGTLRFEAGETRLTVAVPTLPDDLVEGIERFTVELDRPVGATIADGSGLGTIADDAERRIEVVSRTVLPEIGRALAFSAVRCRIGGGSDAPPSRAGAVVGGVSLAVPTTSGGRRAGSVESLTFEQVLGDSSFLLPSSEEGSGPGRFATWGCGDYRHLGGDGGRGAVAWDGEVFSLHVGADVRLGAGLLAGLSVSRSTGSFDYYAPGGAGEKGGGAYELRLVGVHPYLSWSASPEVDVWGMVGQAWGQARIVDEVVGEARISAATLSSAAVGVSGRLLTRGATALRVNAEGALARMDLAGAPALDAVMVDMRRVRVSTETSHRFAFSSGASLTPWGELGVRHDGGDGETGAGVEVGAGVRYRSAGSAWTVEGYGRRLVAHERALREWGVGALIRFAPEESGRGPSLSLLPSWGDPASGVDRLWEHGTADPAGPGDLGTRVDAQFGYGFAALRGRGVVTPFGAVSVDEGQGRGYRLGWQLAVSRAARVSLEAERRERAAARVAHVVLVRGSVRF